MYDDKTECLLVALWCLPASWNVKQALLFILSEEETDPIQLDDLNLLWNIANDYAYNEWKFIEHS